MRLAEKYKPKNISEVIGQQEAVAKLLNWLAVWKKGRAMIFHGPPGVGKSALVQALAREKNFEFIEVAEENAETIVTAAKQHSLLRKQKVILFENVDFADTKLAKKIVENSIFPVILTVDNIYSNKSRTLKAFCDVIEFKRISPFTMEKKLKEIAQLESIESSAIKTAGDMRAALIDLDSGLDSRDREPTVFEVLRALFKGNISEAEKALEACGEDLNTLMRWVEENIPTEFSDARERAAAFELLSKIDYLRRRQDATKLLTTFTKVHKGLAPKFTSYRPPLMRPWKVGEDVTELAAAMHCSARKAQAEAWILSKCV